MPNWNRIVREHLAVLRLPPDREIEVVEELALHLEAAYESAQLEREHPAVNTGRSAQAEPLQDFMSEGVRQSLWVLLSSVGFILLIACVNVANLLLMRAAVSSSMNA